MTRKVLKCGDEVGKIGCMRYIAICYPRVTSKSVNSCPFISGAHQIAHNTAHHPAHHAAHQPAHQPLHQADHLKQKRTPG